MKYKNKKEDLPLINEKINAPRVQVILDDGENIGVIPRFEAMRRAEDANLDLVMIAEQGSEGVPVTKIMDFGKSLYERKKKQNEAKKHQKIIQVKEIKIRPKIGAHDFETKMNRAIEFLEDGKRVKMTLWFRGRENAMKEQHGAVLFGRVEKALEEHGFADLMRDRDTKMGQTWSRVYYTKQAK